MSDIVEAFATVSDQGKNKKLKVNLFKFFHLQGSQGTCSCHALGKSVVDGFQRGIFVPGVAVDFNQEAVIHVLLNEYKVNWEFILFIFMLNVLTGRCWQETRS